MKIMTTLMAVDNVNNGFKKRFINVALPSADLGNLTLKKLLRFVHFLIKRF